MNNFYPKWWKNWPGYSPVWPWILLPFTTLYVLITYCRSFIIQSHRFAVPVACVGSISVGGVGKSPVVLELVKLLKMNINVHVIGHGYKAKQKTIHKVNPNIDTATTVGDEALMIAAHTPVWIGGTRPERINAAIQEGAKLVIMDDGWQDPSVVKDCVLIVVDGVHPLGNGWRLPMGPLRRSSHILSRVDYIIRVNNNLKYCKDKIIGSNFYKRSTIDVFRNSYWYKQSNIESKSKVVVFCGIGQPEQFFIAAKALCAKNYIAVEECLSFADHHLFSNVELINIKQTYPNATLVTTLKDWYRLTPEWRKQVDVIGLDLVWKDTKQFLKIVEHLLNLKH